MSSTTKRIKDNSEFFGMTRRMIRAAGRRVTAEDPSDLVQLLKLRAQLDEVISDSARSLHEQGWSWGEIATELTLNDMPVTPQGARQRWAK